MRILQRANFSSNSGQAMVEMALIIFFLVLLIFGMTEFGRAMYTKNTLTNAARAAARVAAVTPPSSFPSLSETSIRCSAGVSNPQNTIYDAVCKGIAGGGGIHAPGILPLSAVVSISFQDPNNPSGTPTTPATGYAVTVRLQSNFDPVLNLMQNMISPTLAGQATMRYE